MFAAREAVVRDCSGSFFDLVREHFRQCPERKEPFHRFLGWMRVLGAETYTVEDLEIVGELNDEREALQHAVMGSVQSKVTRFSFFSTASTNNVRDHDEVPNDALVGYAVVARQQLQGQTISYVLESVISWPPAAASNKNGLSGRENYYIHSLRNQNTTVGTQEGHRDFSIIGPFFTQQNGLTSVCAHAAIRCSLNSMSAYTGVKVTNKHINDVLHLPYDAIPPTLDSGDNAALVAGLEGLKASQIKTAIERISEGYLTTESFAVTFDVYTDFDRFLYPYMESGFPVILGVNGWDYAAQRNIKHVVTVLGHTLNADRWTPEARAYYGQPQHGDFYSACDWTDHYIVHDDRQGQFCTIQSDILRTIFIPARNPQIHPVLALAVIPKDIQLTGHALEPISVDVISLMLNGRKNSESLGRWEAELHLIIKEKPLNPIFVTRVTLQDRDVYRAHLYKNLNGPLTSSQHQQLQELPDKIWVCEVTLPSLYTANAKKFGEVIYAAKQEERHGLQPEAPYKAGTKPVNDIETEDQRILECLLFAWFDVFWSSRTNPKFGGADWPMYGLAKLI